ncbi:alpha/beta hydrolase [Paenibacillus puerhi]|uniref:alpha/beta hydrolase n=1 Tax=Paenibacillus puerhi TaxID=2692622 RepID=UPI001357F482|nr:alpha/beta fold hydrolase [Paenibacillus puerhi]
MALEAVVFRNSRNQELVGVLHHGEGEGLRPCLIVCHGFAGTKIGGSRRFVEFARYAARRNVSVFRFDFAGSGDSDGELTELTLDRELEDLHAAISTAAQFAGVDPDRIGVVGHCMGAVTALRGAAGDARIYRTVAWAPFTDLRGTVSAMVGEDAFSLLEEGDEADFIYNEQLFSCGPAIVQAESGRFDLAETLERIRTPLLLIHGSEDGLVPVSEIRSAFERSVPAAEAAADKRLIVLEGAHHSFPYHKEELFELTVDWFLPTLAGAQLDSLLAAVHEGYGALQIQNEREGEAAWASK